MLRLVRWFALVAVVVTAALWLAHRPASARTAPASEDTSRSLTAAHVLMAGDATDIDDTTPDDGGVEDAVQLAPLRPLISSIIVAGPADDSLPVAIALDTLASRGPPRL